nr:TetR family transcriptional regulator [Myxococcota bacterium]
LLAERADVRVSTVYRYFANKTGVLVALGERVVSEWDAWAERELAKLDGRSDWRPTVERATWSFLEQVRELPGHAAIRRAMRAVPELSALDQLDNERLSEAYARALRRVEPGLAPGRASSVARCLVETTGAIVDLALEARPRRSTALMEELVEMQRAYLESVLA